MSTRFKELVISGSFGLVKGFLLGYRCGLGVDFRYFFHRKSGIRRDTLAELVKEVLELDNYVHLCLEESAVEKFKAAVSQCSSLVGMEVKKERLIRQGSFNFSFSVNNREVAGSVKKVLEKLPAGVHLKGYNPREMEDRSVEDGSAGYAPLHEYTFRGQGAAQGDFDGVMELFLTLRRLPDSDVVLVSEIALEFGD